MKARKLSSDWIRNLFPNPRRACPDSFCRHGTYCVGGAFLQAYKGENIPFPSPATIAMTLREANPKLPFEESTMAALNITDANDRGAYDLAWEHLDRALSFTEGDQYE